MMRLTSSETSEALSDRYHRLSVTAEISSEGGWLSEPVVPVDCS